MHLSRNDGERGWPSPHLLVYLVLGAPLQVPLHLAVRRRLGQGEILIPIISLTDRGGKNQGDAAPHAQRGNKERKEGGKGRQKGWRKGERRGRRERGQPLT